jgi:hypothetical protein
LNIAEFLRTQGLPPEDPTDKRSTSKRFPDGAQYRVEIPSIEYPDQLRKVIELSEKLEVPVHRISQGSGVLLLTDKELEQMVDLCKSEKLELSLFTGPRAIYDLGGSVKSVMGNTVSYKVRGADQISFAIEDIKRGVRFGVRSFLISDEGLLWVLNEMREKDEIPKDVIFKISVAVGCSNPASALLFQKLGGDTLNVSTDLTLSQLASIRAAIDIPLDVYVTVPSSYGGFIRHYEVTDMIRMLSPIYTKFSIPLGQNVYPAGRHFTDLLLRYAEEEVRQARISYELIRNKYPEAKISSKGGAGLAVPK